MAYILEPVEDTSPSSPLSGSAVGVKYVKTEPSVFATLPVLTYLTPTDTAFVFCYLQVGEFLNSQIPNILLLAYCQQGGPREGAHEARVRALIIVKIKVNFQRFV